MDTIKKIQINLNNQNIIGKNIYYTETITSTNTIMLNNSNKLFSNGDVLIAETQTAGLGRYNRKWDSIKGGLYFSMFFQQINDLQNFYKFIIFVAFAVKEELEKQTKDYKNFKIKWPNDIYYKDKKICGILSQSRIQREKIRLVIGVGININNIFSKKTEFNNPPISMKTILNKNVNIYAFLENLINKINFYYNEFTQNNFTNYLPLLNNSLYKKNKKIKLTKLGKTISIRPLEISHNGYLIGEIDGQKELFSFGEIE
ncbi:MAG: biotin--[acetyl-CoA-carboxylase] ligase [Candidatus Marinimicrobia bacterium]|nr:biotin--[acetyl-CoA-carboxylase] ligase [Candidatus Neomarinimicrobiota bacterium]